MSQPKKVSFDFDDTLSLGYVQMYAKQLIGKGYEVWCVTARQSNFLPYIADTWNDDLYYVCEDVGIPIERIKFMNLTPKYEFFKDSDFIWHLDDYIEENREINKHTKVKSHNHFLEPDWMKYCNELLEE